MNNETKNRMIEHLNNGLLSIVEQVINDKLGIATSLEVKSSYYLSDGWVLNIVERGNETNKQLTATPLLAHLFSSATLTIDVKYNEKHVAAVFSTAVRYGLNGGGSNGHNLMNFAVYLEDNHIEIL